MASATSTVTSLIRSLRPEQEEPSQQGQDGGDGLARKLPGAGMPLAAGAALGAVAGYGFKKVVGNLPQAGPKQVKQAAKSKADEAKGMEEKIKSVEEAMAGKSTGVGKAMAAVGALRGGSEEGGGESVPKLRDVIEEHIDVAVPRNVAYNQWTQFEDFPQVMKGVSNVSQSEDDKVSFSSHIGIWDRTWRGEIVEQKPDERIAWKREEGGVDTWGVITFHSLDERLTRIMVQMELHPEGLVEWMGQTFRIPRRRVRDELNLNLGPLGDLL